MDKCIPRVFSSGSDHRISPTASKGLSGWGFITPVFAALALVLLAQGSALATSGFKALFNNKYGTTGTVLDTCNLCHTAAIPNLNPYGQDFLNAGANAAALDTIANVDSDGDGATNITEINALTFPGDPASVPPPGGLPVPTSQSVFGYPAVTAPLISETAASARPVGLGQVAVGGNTMDLRVGLAPTTGPVDVYFALQINGGDILLLTSAGQFQSVTAGLAPLFAGSMGNFDQSLFGAFDASALPPATYNFYMLVTPAGDYTSFYIYATSLTIAGP